MSKKKKSYWNFRVLAKKIKTKETKYIQFGIYEVYYKNGKPDGYSKDPIVLTSCTEADLEWEIEAISKAFKQDILWYGKKFPKKY